MATGPRTRGISGVGVGTRPGRHQGGVQLVVTRPGEASAGLRSKSCNISPSDLLTFLSFSTEMLQFVFRGTAPNISISAILCGATGLRHVDCRDIWLWYKIKTSKTALAGTCPYCTRRIWTTLFGPESRVFPSSNLVQKHCLISALHLVHGL